MWKAVSFQVQCAVEKLTKLLGNLSSGPVHQGVAKDLHSDLKAAQAQSQVLHAREWGYWPTPSYNCEFQASRMIKALILKQTTSSQNSTQPTRWGVCFKACKDRSFQTMCSISVWKQQEVISKERKIASYGFSSTKFIYPSARSSFFCWARLSCTHRTKFYCWGRTSWRL